MPRKDEKHVISEIKKAFSLLDCCHIRKRTPYVKGDPDLTGSYHGMRIEIEVKTIGGVVSKLQEKRVERWQELECISGIAWSVEEAVDIIWPHLTSQDQKKLANYKHEIV
ncbi:MAG TPA: hypothetical protein VMW10_01100 [Alphaproteobacteria bacterium]|nr:hypothetical protein [Alphaproteobacteria bacterium]